ncbi:MAG: hypothetical protein WC141_00335 [Arcobacteraceae bacterium]
MKKLADFIALFILSFLIALVFHFDSFKTISTSLDSILPQSEQKELLKKFNEFQSIKKIFLYVKGLNKESLESIKALEKKFVSIDGVSLEKLQTNEALQEYKNSYLFYRQNIDPTKINVLDISEELSQLKSNLLSSDFSYFINPYDPLNLTEKESVSHNFSIKNNHLIVKELGYLSIFTLDSSINSLLQYEEIYTSIQKNIPNAEHIKVFSPIFYFVENSLIIKDDVNRIIILSTIILLLLYIFILKNIKLLINTLSTLASSVLLALFISSFIFEELSVFVLVFGISISTVAIDYMFHHYVHQYYEIRKPFNKEVLFGLLTTVGAFFIISFIDFELIKQLCYFTIISLLFSYIQFAFLYPKIGFTYIELDSSFFKSFPRLRPWFIMAVSLILIMFSLNTIEFDSNLKHLDVENKKLNTLQEFFNTHLTSQNNTPFLIKAASIENLILYSKQLKKEFPNAYTPLATLITSKEYLEKKEHLDALNLKKIKKKLQEESLAFGFKQNFFDHAYGYEVKEPIYTLDALQTLGFEVLLYKDQFISYVNLPKEEAEALKKYEFIENLSIKEMFEKTLLSMKNDLLLYGGITVVFILFMMLLNSRKNLLTCLAFIVFPFSLIVSLSFLTAFNILHLFMLFIILAISIDFGIYSSSENKNANTNKAIYYSLLSTFAGFGVLVFSEINALYSIGIVASTGIVAIAFLLTFLKGPSYDA